MFAQNKKLLWLGIFIVTMLGILVWRVFLWKTSLIIEAPAPFTVNIKTERQIKGLEFTCSSPWCAYKVSPHAYTLQVESEGYFPETRQIEAFWKKENKFSFHLQKIPTLTPLSEKPEEWTTFEEKNTVKNIFMEESGKLFLRNDKGNILLAEFFDQDTSKLQIFYKNDTQLFVLSPDALYEVDILQKRKFKILSRPNSELKNTRVFSNALVIEKEKETFFFFPSTREVSSFPGNPNSHLICQNPNNEKEFFFVTAEKESSVFQKINLETNIVSKVAMYSFSGTPESIFCKSEHILFLKTNTELFQLSI